MTRIKDMTGGIGADALPECVGTAESVTWALRSARPGGLVGYVGVPHLVGYVGVPHGVNLPGGEPSYSHAGLRGGPAAVRRFLPEPITLACTCQIDPGKVFDLTLPLDQVAEGYRAMDERRVIKALHGPRRTPVNPRERYQN